MAHGWLGLPHELAALGAALDAAGFEVEHVRHYSLFGRFEEAIDAVLAKIQADTSRPVHLIGFSYGGLIMRRAAEASPVEICSLLLIAVPNVGSPFADCTAGINFATDTVFATFVSVDPKTGMPPDLLTGFLLPEDGPGYGRGGSNTPSRPSPDCRPERKSQRRPDSFDKGRNRHRPGQRRGSQPRDRSDEAGPDHHRCRRVFDQQRHGAANLAHVQFHRQLERHDGTPHGRRRIGRRNLQRLRLRRRRQDLYALRIEHTHTSATLHGQNG